MLLRSRHGVRRSSLGYCYAMAGGDRSPTFRLVGSAVLVLTSCGRIAFDPLGDAGPTDVTTDGAPCALGPWGNITPLTSLASSGDELGPALHPNGLELMF